MRSARHTLAYLPLFMAAIVMLLPFAYLICASVKTSDDFFSTLFLPDGDGLFGVSWHRLTFEHYRRLFQTTLFVQFLINSIFLASVTSLLATLVAAMGGYALAKFEFPGRKLFSMVVLTALVVPSVLLLAPTYQVLFKAGLLDSYAGVIFPLSAPAFGVYLFRQAILTSVPDELIEAARIDGSGEFRCFFSMILPMVRPMMGAFLMITFLGTWNNFIWPQVVLQSPEKQPLSVAIAQLKGVYSQDYGMLMAGTVVSIAPVMALFLLLQRDFISGLTAGSVKG